MKRTLTLKKQTLTELTTDDLVTVVGANGTHTYCETGITYCQICNTIDRTPITTLDEPCSAYC